MAFDHERQAERKYNTGDSSGFFSSGRHLVFAFIAIVVIAAGVSYVFHKVPNYSPNAEIK